MKEIDVMEVIFIYVDIKPQMANNLRDSYYALKTVEIGFNIAAIAKNSDFWRLEVKIGGQ